MTQDGGPDVEKDGSIKRQRTSTPEFDDSGSLGRVRENLRYTLETFWLRQRSNAWSLVRLSGFAAFFFGAFRLFGIGVFGMDGIGPLPREFFTAVYLPGPWSSWSTVWELAFLWMGIGIAIVGFSTRQRRPGP